MKLYFLILAFSFNLTSILEACFFYSSSNYKQLGLLGDDRFHYNNYWRPPSVAPEDAEDEAVMLIGGKHCLNTQCEMNYTRINSGKLERKYKVFPSHDNTVKFFTQYGFCRLKSSSVIRLPFMPVGASSVGAVVLPDGRVLICGGVLIELIQGGRFATKNSTNCWYWIHGTTKILPLEFYSKLPFPWLGPFTPKMMQLVRFDDFEEKSAESDSSKNTLRHSGTGRKHNEPFRFNENYRIVILPWPAFTDAYQVKQIDQTVDRGGDLIEGQVKHTEFGPRIFWKKHSLQDMPMGYGGCYVLQRLDKKTFRIHTFGGREIGVDIRGNDLGWTQNPHLLAKFPRNLDIQLVYLGPNGTNSNLEVVNNGSVTRLKCQDPINPADLANFTDSNGNIVNEEARARFFLERRKKDAKHEKATVMLEQDRIFHTCHVLPISIHNESTFSGDEIILVGGGTARFIDRPSILSADYTYTPIYREIATYRIPDSIEKTPLEACQLPRQSGKGYWTEDDKLFGYGLNVPRTRHASEIIKTKDLETNATKLTLWVFGGYSLDVGGGSALDTLESFQLGSDQVKNFVLHDDVNSEKKRNRNGWKYRLPWPLFDITTVKIPVSWLPKECLQSYLKHKKEELEVDVPPPKRNLAMSDTYIGDEMNGIV